LLARRIARASRLSKPALIPSHQIQVETGNEALSTMAFALWTPAGVSANKHTLEEGRLCVRRFGFGGHNK
jgi:hypothetical protein